MNRAAAWVRKYGPRRLMRSTRSKLSGDASRMSFRSFGATPALFTRRSSRPKPRAHRADEPLRRVVVADVGLEVAHLATRAAQLLQRGLHLRRGAHPAHGQIPPLAGQRLRAPEADAPGSSRDQRDAPLHHSSRSGRSTQQRLREDSRPLLRELHALGPLEQGPAEGLVDDHVPQEQLPLRLERVLVLPLLGQLLPGREEVDRAGDVGVPDRPGRRAVRLDPAVAQAGHRRAQRAVHLQREEVVAAHAHVPGGVEVGDDAALQLEGGVGGVVRRALRRACRCSSQRRGMCVAARQETAFTRPKRLSSTYRQWQSMSTHDPAALLLAVVPGRPLRGDEVALEHPVAELPAHREDAAEEPAGLQVRQLHQARAATACPAPRRASRRVRGASRYSSRASAVPVAVGFSQ